MSQYTPEKEIYKTEHSKPAIGLIATRENEAELTRTVLQATRQGYDVLVTHGEETEPEAVDLARMLDARIVYPDHADTDRESLVSTLAVAARTADSARSSVPPRVSCPRFRLDGVNMLS